MLVELTSVRATWVVQQEKSLCCSASFLYSKRPIKGSVFVDFALVNMHLYIFTYASENPFPWLWCGDDVTCSNLILLGSARALQMWSKFDYQIWPVPGYLSEKRYLLCIWQLLNLSLPFRPMGMVDEACLSSNAYYPRTPDCTLYSGIHVCWTFWFVIRLRIYEFGLWLRYHDRNYLLQSNDYKSQLPHLNLFDSKWNNQYLQSAKGILG